MASLPSDDEIRAYAAKHKLQAYGRTAIIRHMLDSERREKVIAAPLPMLDATAFVAGLKAIQDEADRQGVRSDVLCAAVPAAAAHIVKHSLTTDTKGNLR